MKRKSRIILFFFSLVGCFPAGVTAFAKPAEKVVARKWVTKLKQNSFFNRRPFQFATPEVSGGKVYVGVHKEIFYAIDAKRGKKLWKFKTHGPVHAQAKVHDGKVYFGDMEGVVYALDAETGKPLWMTRLAGPVMSAPLMVGSRLYIPTLTKHLAALDLAEGKIIWQVNFSGPESGFSVNGSADPVLFGDRILVGYSDGALMAHYLADGQPAWVKQLGDPVAEFHDVDATVRLDSPAIVADNTTAYVTSADGRLYALNPNSGEILWRAEAGGVNEAALADSHLYVTAGGVLYCFQKENGKILWEQDLEVEEISSPGVYENRLVTVAAKGKAYFLDRTTGDILYSWYVRGGSYSDPVIDGQRVYILSNAGRLYAFEFK